MNGIDSLAPIPVDPEDPGVPADNLLMNNPRFAIDMLVMLARRVTGPFGGFITISPPEMMASQRYRLNTYIKGVDPKTGEGKASYMMRVSPPPGWSPLATKKGSI